MNILFYAYLCELTCKATQDFLYRYYSPNNVLMYDMAEKCEFKPKLKKENIYNAKNFVNRRFRNEKGYWTYPPVDEALLDSMSRYEGRIYKMMNIYFPPLESFNEMQQTYFNVLRLMNGIIEKNKIDCFIMYGPPHQLFDYIIYCLCKVKNLKTILIWRVFTIEGYIYYYHDVEKYFDDDLENDKYELDDIFLDSYKLFRDSKDGVQPWYMRTGSVKKELDFQRKRVEHFFHYKGYIKNLRIIANLHKKKKDKEAFINRNSQKPNYHEKYLYFALHYLPEATTSPCAGVYANQQLAIQMLSYYVPDDVFIYVKEHPNQSLGGEKYRRFFEEISEMRNVKIIPTKWNSNELANNCLACVTCTGTIAYECMYKKKPSILFGYSIYNDIPGAFTVRTNSDCEKAIHEIIKGVTILDGDILHYLKKIRKNSYHAEYVPLYKGLMSKQGVSVKENNATVYRMLCDAMEGLINHE